jgi:hypothetical protein
MVPSHCRSRQSGCSDPALKVAVWCMGLTLLERQAAGPGRRNYRSPKANGCAPGNRNYKLPIVTIADLSNPGFPALALFPHFYQHLIGYESRTVTMRPLKNRRFCLSIPFEQRVKADGNGICAV